MVDGAPRPPGAGPSLEPSPVAVDDSPFSLEERQRITSVDPWVEQAAMRHRLDPDLLRGMIWVESRYDVRATSPAGARGLMQLMPATARALAERIEVRGGAYDPEFNVLAGSLYLSDMMERYDGNVVLALAAYNAGPGNVDRWLREDGGLPPRSREYAALVLAAKTRFETVWSVPDERPVPTQLATSVPVRAPAPVVIPEPPTLAEDGEDDIEVRYDLDRVETPYVNRPAGEVPERAPVPVVEAAPAEGPETGVGVLPSVAD